MGGCVSSSTTTSGTRLQSQNRPIDRPEVSPDDSQLIPLTDLPTNPTSSNDRTATNTPLSDIDPSSSATTKGKEKARVAPSATPSLPSSSSRFSLGSLRRRPGGSVMSRRNVLDVLREYATLPHPQSTLPANILLFANRQCIAIFDAYPKAKYHFLVLPRYPFPSQSDGETIRSLVKLDHLDDLQSLLTKPSPDAREEIINAMLNTAREVEEMIRDEMVKTEGFEWKIDVGFHAVPSMKHVHLHVISEDRIAPGYKTKKHHNSFRPDLGFFLDIMEVERWTRTDEAFVRERARALPDVAAFLDSQLACFKCDEYFSNMPKLKSHLEKEWKEEKKKTLERIRTTGRQYRSSDEDDLF